jgi:sirohydrochlorin cobaltochelatase
VGTVEGTPGLEWVVAKLKEKGAAKALLVPLMSVAGDHARNDMAGDEDDSWKSVLAGEGIAARPVLQGLAELAPFRALWLNHLRQAVAGLDEN